SNVTPGTTYSYTVSAVNNVGEGAQSNELFATPNPATPPDAPKLGGQPGYNLASLTWSQPASNGAPITGYKIYRGTASGSETFLATTAGTTYTDASGALGTTYYYEVTATNSVGESTRSNEVSATPVGPVFQQYQAVPVGSSPKAVAVGDVTGDGRNDVVLTTW